MSACDDCLRRSAQVVERVEPGGPNPAFEAGRLRRRAEATGLGSICRHEGGFPTGLGDAPDGPAMLYFRGERSRLERLATEPVIALVGSRRASPYGREVAHSLARELVACGTVVVSGLAFGVDSAAHEGALDGGGLTVAVLGGGADVPYPRSNRGLYKRIATDGLIVSEMPPGLVPRRWCFPARNRIMAALAVMTVVVEGTDRSGSLITARFATDLGREVGAVPGQVTSTLAHGPNALLADGACVIRSASDVLDAIYGPGSLEARAAIAKAELQLDDQQRLLLEAVEQGRGSPDLIVSASDQVGSALAGLTELEMMGLIRREPDGRYTRCA